MRLLLMRQSDLPIETTQFTKQDIRFAWFPLPGSLFQFPMQCMAIVTSNIHTAKVIGSDRVFQFHRRFLGPHGAAHWGILALLPGRFSIGWWVCRSQQCICSVRTTTSPWFRSPATIGSYSINLGPKGINICNTILYISAHVLNLLSERWDCCRIMRCNEGSSKLAAEVPAPC